MNADSLEQGRTSRAQKTPKSCETLFLPCLHVPVFLLQLVNLLLLLLGRHVLKALDDAPHPSRPHGRDFRHHGGKGLIEPVIPCKNWV